MAVWLAFLAAALSFLAVAVTYTRTGRIEVTPLFGGLFMLALGIAGRAKLRRGWRSTPAPPDPRHFTRGTARDICCWPATSSAFANACWVLTLA